MGTSEILMILALVCTLVAAFTQGPTGRLPYVHAGWLGVSLWIFSILIAR